MNGRRAGIGLVAISVLALSAIFAASASANTAYVCENIGAGATFSDAHCLDKKGGPYSHVQVLSPIIVTATNANTLEGTTAASTTKFRGTASGVEFEFQCTTLGGTGTLENKKEGTATWTEVLVVLNYTGCSVTKPAGKGCVVKGNKITTNEWRGSSEGLTNQLKFTPASGTEFFPLTLESCSLAGLNKTFPLTGSFIATTSGATVTDEHATITTQNTLKFAGQKAGFDGSLTLKDEGGSGIGAT
jgi:hypothetical protein